MTLITETAFDFSLFLVSLEMGDVPLVSVMPENLQLPAEKSNRGHLITHLQELLEHWVLWSAVKSRWVIVGKEGGGYSICMDFRGFDSISISPQALIISYKRSRKGT